MFSDAIKAFVDRAEWIYAKSYADTWPHEYLVRDGMPEYIYQEICRHIEKNGQNEKFYTTPQRYVHEDGYSYWVMADGHWQYDQTGIINRTPTPLYYGERMRHRLGPQTQRWKSIAKTLYETGPSGRPVWAKGIKKLLEGLYERE